MSNTSVVVKIDQAKINGIEKKAVAAMVKMGYDIASQARYNAPYLTGALRNSIRVAESRDGEIEVIAGGSYAGYKVPYAMKREQGPNKNPATVGYMRKAAEKVMTGDYIKKYFGDLT